MRKIITAFMLLFCVACMASAADYLTFTAEEDNSTFGIVNNGGNNPDVQYSLDGGETWTALTGGKMVTLAHKGDKALLKGDNPQGFSKGRSPYSSFRMTGKVAASGSVMSLIDGTGLSTEIPKENCFNSLFKGCASLTQAPELPATTLTENCYRAIFFGCTSLTQAPNLPATTLAEACYFEMFSGCTSLTQAPELPATTLAEGCYNTMFYGCTSLTQAPELPATTLAGFCYKYMLYGCTSLTQAPELPVTTLAESCYSSMFSGCTNLTQAPELPATELAKYCYSSMFSGCTSLTQAPELPATMLVDNCYQGMFQGCTNLSEIHVPFYYWDNGDGTSGWVKDVASTGTFICPETLPLEYGMNRMPIGWDVKKIIDGDTVDVPVSRDYLTFTAEEDSSTFGIVSYRDNNPDVKYSLDGGETWTKLAKGDMVVLAHKGDKALLRGDNPQVFSKDRQQYSSFTMTGKVAASGNVMTLIDGAGLPTKIPSNCYFCNLFLGCKALTQAPELPATTLTEFCYSSMFSGCTSLTQAPNLPATTLAEACYFEMFSGCTSLTQALKLPATTLTSNCYEGMYSGCTSLTQAPELPAWKLDGACYSSMFSGCTSLTQAPALPASTLTHLCYYSMFSGCTSLTQAPNLPATTLASNCYEGMFSGCTSLTQAPELPATVLYSECYDGMFSGCTSLTQAPALPASTLTNWCYQSMFYGCTSLTRAPELPATMLASYCYRFMFSGCTSLTEIKVSYGNWRNGNGTSDWVKDVAPTGTFICPKALALEYGMDRIPEGWTVKYIEDLINYLTFTAEEDGSSFGIVNMNNNNPDVQYSLDGGETWTALVEGDTVVLAHVGDKALLRGVNPQGFSKKGSSSFRMTGKVAASGSVMSLIDGLGVSKEIPGEFCFHDLFRDCTSLTQTPALPATTLADYCYYGIFSGCTSLTQAPELPATVLAEGCYAFMFSGCTSLTQAPALPAMTLAGLCYENMFYGCTSLTRAPELPATTLAEACYDGMFQGCTSLTQAPVLPATTLPTVSNVKGGCYIFMFSGCTSLSRIRVSFDDWNDGLHTLEWVKDVAPTGTFYCPKALPLEYGVDRIPEGWTVKYIEDEPNYLAFTAEEDGSSFGIVNKVESYPEVTCSPDIWYSTDGGYSWNELKQGDTIPLKKGKKALLKGVNPKGVSIGRSEDILDGITYVSFVMSGKIAASGNVMSLVDGEGKTTQIPANYCFYGLFSGCESLTQAPVLPATMLTEYCYGEMFAGCTGLTEAPELPATDMKRGCYASMFSGCNLTQAPKLPALNLAPSCYGYMFSWNKMLTQAPELPATELADSCYDGMFLRCEKLVQAPILLATKLKPHCYSSMFEGCISLTQAPELIATELAPFCYCRMFHSCTGLTEAPELPDTKELVSDSYRFMFSYCSNLNTIKVHFKAWVKDNYSGYCWVNDVSPTGTFYCSKELPIEYGIARIPKGWTVICVEDISYLTFTAEEDSSMFGIVNNGGNNPDVQYSLDGGETWTTLTQGDTVILAHKGDKALLKGNNPEGFSKSREKYSTFTMTGKVAASGSVMSLIDGVGVSTEIPNTECFNSLFMDCASLTQAPELPATTLASSCYERMFSGCTSLTQAPELPATTLANSCYYIMFSGCTSLTQAPELPALTMANSCYYNMFAGCTSLTQAPELPATTLSSDCYYSMFAGCTSLTQAPALPATTLAPYCYRNMFAGCTSLTQAPELPATKTDRNCYQYMFYGCTSLTKAPVLPATSLAGYCYYSMFSGCTSLSEINVSFTSWLGTEEWVTNVAPTGTFICPKALALEYGVNRIPEGWTVKYIEDLANYLTFTAEEDGSTFGIVNNGGNNPDVQYSLDGGETWTALAAGDTITLAHKGDKALLRGGNSRIFSKGLSQYSSFTMTGKVAASGSVMSLIDRTGLSTEIPGNYCFYSLFAGCTGLTQAPELPATTLTEDCYRKMFSGCTGLTQAPELPATTLTGYCYLSMFSGCTGLTQAPELPATTLAEACYVAMFSDCTNLTQAPELPSTTLAQRCYESMFSGCTSLTLAPELPATNLAFGCYSHMFLGCTSLAQTPKLPATTLVASCYQSMFSDCVSLTSADLSFEQYVGERSCCNDMFRGCTNLSEIKVSFEEWGYGDLENPRWVENVALTGTFICPKDLPIEYGVSRIPAGWTVKNIIDGDTVDVPVNYNYLTFTAEEDGSSFGIVNYYDNNPYVQYSLDGGETWTALTEGDSVILAHKGDKALLRGVNPQGISRDGQYSTFKMTGKVAASGSVMSLIDGVGVSTEVPGNYCFYKLFQGCTSLTQAPELPATTLAVGCYYEMFSGCTSLTQAPELPATTLAYGCYSSMFSGCTSLTQAPELPATSLNYECYMEMFSGCTSLSEINVSFTSWTSNYATPEWVYNVAPTGTFICPKGLPLEYGASRIPVGWAVKNIIDGDTVDVPVNYNYLTFTAEEDGSSFGIVNNGDNNPDVQYSLDGGETWTALTEGDSVVLAHKGDKALLRGDNPQAFSGRVGYSSFTMTGKVAASGSVMSLIDGIGLSTASLIPDCLKSLFKDCASLTQAPELPSTDINRNCYESMFAGCTSLTKAPALPATFLAGDCYRNLFSGCTNLSEINVSFTSWSNSGTDEWVKDVAPTGTFICPKELPLEYGVSRIPEGWTVKYIEDMPNYLTFTAEEDGSTFGIVNNGGNNPDIHYSLDGGETWTALAAGDTITLAHKGDKALLKGNNPEGFSKDWRQYSSFKMTGKVAASGSVMSLIDGVGISTEVPENLCFYKLFQGCTSLTQAPELPATTLAYSCYRNMFEGCTSLTQAPKLPATTLAEACYFGMFSSCTSLTQAPELPATTLPTTSNVENGCYSSMFEFCTSLTRAPELPATTLAEGCYTGMFYACTSLTQAPKLPATTLADFCYASMFDGCTSLTQAPELPATTLTDFCYDRMFFGCTSLSKINVSFATWSDYYSSTDVWAKDVAPTGTFICPKALPLEYGESRIPEGWTVKYVDEGSGVSSALADGVTVWTDELTIFVRGAEGKVSLYDMSGRIVATSNSKDEVRALCVPAKDAYVVRANGGSSVVLVR